MWLLAGTQRIRLAMVCERKSGEECQTLEKSMQMPIFQELGTALNLFSMEDNKNPIASHRQEQPPLKTIFISVLQMKSSSTC
jgi:hypothetical protein